MSDAAPSSDATPDASSGGAVRAWGRRIGRGLAGVVIGVLALVLAVLLAVQVEPVATPLAEALAQRFVPLEGTTIEVGGASGTWLTGLTLRDVRLTRPDTAATGASSAATSSADASDADAASTPRAGEDGRGRVTMAAFDTLAATYDLGALLGGRLHLRDVRLAGLRVRAEQAADGSWDWARAADLGASDDDASGFVVQLDRATLARTRAVARFHAPGGRDSTLRVVRLDARLGPLVTGPTFRLRLDTLALEATPPGARTPLTLAAAAALDGHTLTLDTLRLDSPRSRVRGTGTLRLPAGEDTARAFDDVAFRLRADPLALRDVAAFAPGLGLDPGAALTLDVRADGTDRLLRARADGTLTPSPDGDLGGGPDGGTPGTLALDAAFTPRLPAPGDSLRYALDARLDRLALGALGLGLPDTLAGAVGPSATRDRLSADVQIDLRGPARDRLRGPVRLTLREVRLGPYASDSTRLTADMRDGEATLDLDARVRTGDAPPVRLRLRGTARPLDAVPTYDLAAPLDGLDLGALVPGIASDLTGTLRLAGRGLAPANADATARLRLRPSRVGPQRLDTLAVTVRLAEGVVRADVTGRAPEGRLAARARLTLPPPGSDAPLRYRLEAAQVDGLDLLALAGLAAPEDAAAAAPDAAAPDAAATPSPSRFTGRLTAEGAGTDPQTLTLDARLALAGTYGPHRLDTLDVRTRLDGGRLRTDLAVVLDSGRVAATLTGRPFADRAALRVTDGRLDGFDLAPVLRDTTVSSDFNGTFRADLRRGFAPPAMVLDAVLDLGASRLNDQALDGARLAVRLDQGALDATARLATPGGTTQLTATGRPFDDRPTLAVPEAEIAALDLGALLGTDAVSTRLDGRLRLRAEGYDDPGTMTLDADLALARSFVNFATVREARLAVTADSGRAAWEARLALGGGGRLEASGEARDLGATPRLTGRLGLDTLDLGTLAGLPQPATLSLDARLNAEGASLATLTGRVDASSQQGAYAGARLHALALNARLDRGVLHLDTLRADTNLGTVRGDGPLAFLVPDTTRPDTTHGPTRRGPTRRGPRRLAFRPTRRKRPPTRRSFLPMRRPPPPWCPTCAWRPTWRRCARCKPPLASRRCG